MSSPPRSDVVSMYFRVVRDKLQYTVAAQTITLST